MSQSHTPPESGHFRTLWDRQGGLCALCGRAMPRHRFEVDHATLWKKRRPSFDHIRARARGGSDRLENLQLVHAECNWKKGRG
ncbi:MAG: HNH endonuclease [Alphaproteobacteria bacterium HGW-Alphaproteobacteria-18]|nr:MAG: HNH endonuclease [Alphaproteobacteria bacterium HGW-Alphaproteobacteria-18]